MRWPGLVCLWGLVLSGVGLDVGELATETTAICLTLGISVVREVLLALSGT